MAMIYLIRHGQASFASANYDQLSALGIQQANILGTTLKTRKTTIDKCFTGSMQRHHQTAHYCSLTWDIAFSNHENSVWNEYDHMELIQKYNPSLNNFEALANYIRQEKQPLKALQTLLNNAIKDWMANQHDYTLDWETFKAQIWSNLRQLAAEIKKGGSYFIFTSGGPITVVLMQLLGLRDEQFMSLQSRIVNTSITKLLVTKKGLELSTYNDYSHLESTANLITYR